MSTANKILMGASGAGVPVGPSDDEFNRVSFLSHFEGSNNGVNNAFDDSSASNHTITANGDVTQGSFNPYGTNWAVDFSKDTNPRLSCGSSSDFTFGTGDFTVEFFVFFYSLTSYQTPMSAGYSNDSGGMFIQTGNGDGKFQFRSGGSALVSETTSDAEANKWYHIAFSRQSGTLRVYRNGVQTGTASNSTNLNRVGNILIGSDQDFNIDGLLSNFRLVKGTSLYNSNFTPPASALTAVTNTTLLTLQSNRFVDNSASGHTVTPNTGKETVTAFGPFLTSSVYDAAVNGASAYFDGSVDRLHTPEDASTRIAASNFTFEAWVYPTTTTVVNDMIFTQGAPGVYSPFNVYILGTTVRIYISTNGTSWNIASNSTSSNSVQINAWNHIALVRNGTTIGLYINGVADNTYAVSTTAFFTPTRETSVGGRDGEEYFTGYITDARLVIGTAVYTSAFTPPTAPLTAITNTKLLLNMADGQAIDSAAQNNLTLDGNAKISTGQAKFGDTSMVFDGSGDYAFAPHNSIYNLSGDFTVELWAYISSNNTTSLIGKWANSNYAWIVQDLVTSLRFYTGNSGSVGTGYSFSWSRNLNQWYHIAITRSGTTIRAFQDGVLLGTGTNSDNLSSSASLNIGYNEDGGIQYFNGYLDEVRITNGVARYTSNFTAPTAAFPDKGQNA